MRRRGGNCCHFHWALTLFSLPPLYLITYLYKTQQETKTNERRPFVPFLGIPFVKFVALFLYICMSHFVFGLPACIILDENNLVAHLFCSLLNDIEYKNQRWQPRQSGHFPPSFWPHPSIHLHLRNLHFQKGQRLLPLPYPLPPSSSLPLLFLTRSITDPFPFTQVWLLVVINNFHCHHPVILFLLLPLIHTPSSSYSFPCSCSLLLLLFSLPQPITNSNPNSAVGVSFPIPSLLQKIHKGGGRGNLILLLLPPFPQMTYPRSYRHTNPPPVIHDCRCSVGGSRRWNRSLDLILKGHRSWYQILNMHLPLYRR